VVLPDLLPAQEARIEFGLVANQPVLIKAAANALARELVIHLYQEVRSEKLQAVVYRWSMDPLQRQPNH
jgi:hypothetical protein